MRIAFILIFTFEILILNAQTNTYRADLAALKSIIQRTPSFKTQIRGNRRSDYNDLYHRMASDTTNTPNSYQYFYNLACLLFPLRDNHLGFYQIPNYNHFKTKESIDSFTATKEFHDYPSYTIDIDSLKTELAKKPVDSIEGIYHYDKFYSVGLFKSGGNELIGVVLDSDTKLWQRGQIAIHLYQFAPNLYKAIYGHPLYKFFLLQSSEKYVHQSLINSYFYGSYTQSIYTKQRTQIDHVNLPKSASKFELRNIKNDVQYLLIRTFQADVRNMQASQHFYDSIRTLLKAPYLILDLRNNEGGAKKEMKKYFALLKKYVNRGHLYVLLNNGTLSQAEIFTLKLKRLKNITTVGQTTKGMLTYGSNYGRRVKLPSSKFEVYPTDMKGRAKRLQYEDHGIEPDIYLQDTRNWIEQVIKIIQEKISTKSEA